MTLHACIEDLLIRGLDDWIQAGEVASVAYTTGRAQSCEERRDLSFRIIQKLLDDGLAVAGAVDEHRGFVPWDIPADAAIQRIEREWPTRPAGPEPGEVCWLSLTEKGHAHAQRLWSRKTRKER